MTNIEAAVQSVGAKLLDLQAVPRRRLGDVHAVAATCDCSPRTVYRLADAGRMPPPIKLGSLVRWDLDAIDAWINAGCPRVERRAGR